MNKRIKQLYGHMKGLISGMPRMWRSQPESITNNRSDCMKDLKELSNIAQEIQNQLLQQKLSFSEIRYVLSEVQTTFAIMQTTQYLRKIDKKSSLKKRDTVG